jgi:glycosyltransferase involved in cell wall biosynthesis
MRVRPRPYARIDRSDEPRLHLAIIGSRGFPSTYGGYETLVRHLARAWVAKGHDVTVYCRDRPGRKSDRTVEGVRCLWTPGYDSKSWSTLTFGLTSHLRAATRSRVHAALVLNVANGYYLPLLRARGIPVVVNTDGIEWERGKWGVAAKKVFYTGAKLTAAFADVLVSDSEAIGKIWRTEFGVSPRFIPYGGDREIPESDSSVRNLGLTPGSYVLSVARLIPENNVELTLDAIESLHPTPPSVFVGSANYRTPLQLRLEFLHASGKLLWLRHVHDQDLLAQLWAHCGVYVHGHSVGGTNPALVQALGLGAPTLALNTPFNDEVLRNADALYAKEIGCLSAKIRKLLEQRDEAAALSTRGRAIIAARYRWDDVCNAYEAAMRDAHASRTLG